MCWNEYRAARRLVKRVRAGFFLIPLLWLAAGGCAEDPLEDVPSFETLDFDCPVPGGKFLDDANFVSMWTLLGPIPQTAGEGLHTEYVGDEAMLNGNRRAPRGTFWRRIGVRTDDPESQPGEVDFSRYFLQHPRGGQKCVFYACATLKCGRDHRGLVLHAAACGQLKIWLNGTAVYAREQEAADLRSGLAKVEGITLHKGCNRLVVKYLDDGKEYRTRRRFSLRFTDAAGGLSVVR